MKVIEIITKTIKHFQVKRIIAKTENVYKERLKYVFIPKKSDTLLVVFSGFTGEIRKYNYISSFKDLPVNQLYLLDTWGNKGSYYWLDKGSDYPEETIHEFIDYFVEIHGFNHIVTCGSSKGGTAAIYYGLIHHADRIYAGSCQFKVGTYLNTKEHKSILEGMIGQNYEEEMIGYLNEKCSNVIDKYVGKGKVYLLYSTEEPTYDNHIVPLIESLKGKVEYFEQKEKFASHSEVGIYFPKYVHKEMLLTRNSI